MSTNPTPRIQTRQTITPGDPVVDSLWTINNDTGPISGGTAGKLPVVAVTSSGFEVGNTPQNVIDGSLSTRWSSNGVGQWLKLDVGSISSINEVDIAWYNGNTRTSNFVIDVSPDDVTYTNLFTGKSSGTTLSLEKYIHPGVLSGRYVKITVNGNSANAWASITEVAVFGIAGPTPTPTPVPVPVPVPVPGTETLTVSDQTLSTQGPLTVNLTAIDSDPTSTVTIKILTQPKNGTLV